MEVDERGLVSPSHAYGRHSWHARSNQRPHAKTAMQSSPSSGVSGPPQLLGWSPIQVAYLRARVAGQVRASGEGRSERAAHPPHAGGARARARRPVFVGERLAVGAVPRPVALALAVDRADPEAAAAALLGRLAADARNLRSIDDEPDCAGRAGRRVASGAVRGQSRARDGGGVLRRRCRCWQTATKMECIGPPGETRPGARAGSAKRSAARPRAGGARDRELSIATSGSRGASCRSTPSQRTRARAAADERGLRPGKSNCDVPSRAMMPAGPGALRSRPSTSVRRDRGDERARGDGCNPRARTSTPPRTTSRAPRRSPAQARSSDAPASARAGASARRTSTSKENSSSAPCSSRCRRARTGCPTASARSTTSTWRRCACSRSSRRSRGAGARASPTPPSAGTRGVRRRRSARGRRRAAPCGPAYGGLAQAAGSTRELRAAAPRVARRRRARRRRRRRHATLDRRREARGGRAALDRRAAQHRLEAAALPARRIERGAAGPAPSRAAPRPAAPAAAGERARSAFETDSAFSEWQERQAAFVGASLHARSRGTRRSRTSASTSRRRR